MLSSRPRRSRASAEIRLQSAVGGEVVAPHSVVAPIRRRSRLAWLKSDTFWACVVIAPSVLAVLVFIYTFILWTGYISLVNWNDITPTYTWAGFQNFVRLFQTPRFITDLRNTAVFSIAFLAQCLGIGLLLAILLDQRIKGEALFRTVYVLPFAISAIVTGVAWKWLMNPSAGVNDIFDAVGLDFLQNRWYADPNIGILAISIAAAWQMSGYTMALYLAGLRGVPTELRDAATIDGAGGLQYYRYIAIPLVTPVTFTALIILGTIALRLFDMVASMTGGGPAFATDTPAYFMFQTTFQQYRYSVGAAIGVIMLIFAVGLIVPYFFTIKDELER
jgi:glucose/mannose transport system permease protein